MFSFSTAAFVGSAAASLDVLGRHADPAEWQRWTGNTLESARMVGPMLYRDMEGRWAAAEGVTAYRELVGFGLREGASWRIEVSPGSIAFRSTDRSRKERTQERVEESAHELAWLKGMEWARTGIDPDEKKRPRGKVTVWSAKSRAKMTERLNSLDYEPLVAQGAPAMVTLTYPSDWLTVAPDAVACREHMDAFRKRFDRAWGRKLVAVWKREFQRRGAPHYHLLMVPPAGRVKVADRELTFREWLSWAWADIVAHPDPVERMRHELAGTNVDVREGARYRDPRRVGAYFNKHGQYAAKEYQNEAPEEWQDGEAGIGRFWGVWGLKPAVVAVAVSADVSDDLRRVTRRWQGATQLRDAAGAPACVKVEVWRKVHRVVVDTTTGELVESFKWRKRRVTKRIRPRLTGRAGFLAVNDAPALAMDLGRRAEQLVMPKPRALHDRINARAVS